MAMQYYIIWTRVMSETIKKINVVAVTLFRTSIICITSSMLMVITIVFVYDS